MKNSLRLIKRLAAVIITSSIVLAILQPRESMKLMTYSENSEVVLWQETLEMRAKGPLTDQDPNLHRLLREKYLSPPSLQDPDLMLDKTGEEADNYNVYRTSFVSWVRLHGILKRLFSDQPPGFFLEAGALDGEFISNTLFLERELGWTGLLVEADPVLYSTLPGKHRRAWSSQSCISPAPYAEVRIFETYRPERQTNLAAELLIRSTGNLEGVHAPAAGQMGLRVPYSVQCFPLVSYLLALNVTDVRYVSLDVEGAEANILLTFPWDQVNVTVWMVEHRPQNTGFKDFYLEPGGVKPPVLMSETELQGRPSKGYPLDPKSAMKKKSDLHVPPSPRPSPPKKKKNVVYITEHDPAGGKDDYFVLYMKEKGYALYDYWDGDYTFIKTDSPICQKHCNVV